MCSMAGKGTEQRPDTPFKFHLETISSWDATPDDRTVYLFESGLTTTGRPAYAYPEGKKLVDVTVDEGGAEISIGTFIPEIDPETGDILLDPANRVRPIFPRHVEEIRLLLESLPRRLKKENVIVPPKFEEKPQ